MLSARCSSQAQVTQNIPEFADKTTVPHSRSGRLHLKVSLLKVSRQRSSFREHFRANIFKRTLQRTFQHCTNFVRTSYKMLEAHFTVRYSLDYNPHCGFHRSRPHRIRTTFVECPYSTFIQWVARRTHCVEELSKKRGRSDLYRVFEFRSLGVYE